MLNEKPWRNKETNTPPSPIKKHTHHTHKTKINRKKRKKPLQRFRDWQKYYFIIFLNPAYFWAFSVPNKMLKNEFIFYEMMTIEWIMFQFVCRWNVSLFISSPRFKCFFFTIIGDSMKLTWKESVFLCFQLMLWALNRNWFFSWIR